ncbi:transport protein TonB [Vibrio aerogenes CECT 7868]|uniref:Protein TonB n=1 Tax=Vibrio aerogenes CECT 7868 TaxID=1216006 RepID=A0A1M5Z764_9VIBR|nr:energy transducer TonB [Vibrio aerogenes]SHI20075.1 transport protein TonB [Vibrio aerogenes CECT 7868]
MLRWLTAIPLALFASLSLFSFMAWMVDNGVQRASEQPPALRFDMFMTEQQETIQRRQRVVPPKPEVPQKPQMAHTVTPQSPQPVAHQMSAALDMPVSGIDTSIHGIRINGLKLSSGTGSTVSREAIPLYKPKPRYPARAERRNIEGSVTLQFDIDETGKARNITVISSQPKRIFDRSARRAISRWKFKAKIVDGKAVMQKEMTQTINYEINK